ncbi:MAG: hypothetical protein H8F28_10555 [Fibrella sp.]|nr:hypothetical protein [Armatimonadota bacterium]
MPSPRDRDQSGYSGDYYACDFTIVPMSLTTIIGKSKKTGDEVRTPDTPLTHVVGAHHAARGRNI